MCADTGASGEQGRPAQLPAVPPRMAVAFSDGYDLIHPDTGELVNLEAADDVALADYLEAMAKWLESAHDATEAVEAELLRRMDAGLRWTLDTPHGRLEAPSPGTVEYDPAGLRDLLRQLVDAGRITPEAAAACWTTPKPPEPRPAKRGVAALAKLPGVADALERVQRPGRRRRVKLNGRVVG